MLTPLPLPCDWSDLIERFNELFASAQSGKTAFDLRSVDTIELLLKQIVSNASTHLGLQDWLRQNTAEIEKTIMVLEENRRIIGLANPNEYSALSDIKRILSLCHKTESSREGSSMAGALIPISTDIKDREYQAVLCQKVGTLFSTIPVPTINKTNIMRDRSTQQHLQEEQAILLQMMELIGKRELILDDFFGRYFKYAAQKISSIEAYLHAHSSFNADERELLRLSLLPLPNASRSRAEPLGELSEQDRELLALCGKPTITPPAPN